MSVLGGGGDPALTPRVDVGALAFDGRVGLVTGAAQGIGLAVARRLSAEGAAVVVLDIDGDALHAAVDGGSWGAPVVPVVADVADAAAVSGAVDVALGRFGRLDALVNNAAVVDRAGLERDTDVVGTPFEVWDRAFAVNLFGSMVACRFSLPHLVEVGGSIVNVTTIGALRGRWNQVAYGVSKAGLNALTEYVATTYGRQGVRCNAVAPGLVMTAEAERNVSPADQAISASDRLIARPGRPEDIAAAVRFLLSDEASYITGQILVVDGGTINHVPGYSSHAPGAKVVLE